MDPAGVEGKLSQFRAHRLHGIKIHDLESSHGASAQECKSFY